PQPPVSTPPVQKDTRAPRFTKAPRAKKAKRGSSFSYSLDEAAKVTIVVERRVVSKRGRVAFKKAKTLTVTSKTGATRVALKAKKGRSRAMSTARDAAGNAGKPAKLTFAV